MTQCANSESWFLWFAIPHSWADFGAAIGGVAAVVGLGIGLLAAAFAWGQIASARRVQRESLALARYNDYLRLAFEHPRFASGEAGSTENAAEFEKYEWFVSLMLNACEGILLYVGHNKEWMNSIKAQIDWHKLYCKTNPWFRKNYKAHYFNELCEIIDEVVSKPDAQNQG